MSIKITGTGLSAISLRRWMRACVAIAMLLFSLNSASPLNLSLDSIAQWGKFPRFCIKTYRWGDKFFNSYDSTYVQGSGKRWNIKTKFDMWTDVYNFRFDNDYRMEMVAKPSTTWGFHLTYMAVSLGYDMDIGKYFNGAMAARKRFNFSFNCSLFAAELYTMTNDQGTEIVRMGPSHDYRHTDIRFNGINTSSWGLDLYYFFNHKHYSQAAAFFYSKIQMKSSGSLYAGLSFGGQKYNFDFWELAEGTQNSIPDNWGYYYRVRNNHYSLRLGYAFNWVFHRGWCLGVSVSPNIGLRRGYINTPGREKYSFGLSGQGRISLIYNYKKRWFFGVVANDYTGLVYDKQHVLTANNVSVETSVGYRFDLW